MATQSPTRTLVARTRADVTYGIARTFGRAKTAPQLWRHAVRAARAGRSHRSAQLSEQLLNRDLYKRLSEYFLEKRPATKHETETEEVLDLVVAAHCAFRDDLAIKLLNELEINDRAFQVNIKSLRQALALRFALTACSKELFTARGYTEYLLGKFEHQAKNYEASAGHYERGAQHFEKAFAAAVSPRIHDYAKIQAIYTALAKIYFSAKKYEDYEHNAYWAAHMLAEHVPNGRILAAKAFVQLGTQLETLAKSGVKRTQPFDFFEGAAVYFRLSADLWDDSDDTGHVQRAVGLRNQADAVDREHKAKLSNRPVEWESPLQILKGKDHGCNDFGRHPGSLLGTENRRPEQNGTDGRDTRPTR